MVHINANWYIFGKYVRICKYVRVYKLYLLQIGTYLTIFGK